MSRAAVFCFRWVLRFYFDSLRSCGEPRERFRSFRRSPLSEGCQGLSFCGRDGDFFLQSRFTLLVGGLDVLLVFSSALWGLTLGVFFRRVLLVRSFSSFLGVILSFLLKEFGCFLFWSESGGSPSLLRLTRIYKRNKPSGPFRG